MTSEQRAIGRSGRRAIGICILAASGLAGCTRFENVMASIPVFSYLRNAPSLDPYEAPRPAPPGAVPYASPAGDVPPPILPTAAGLEAFGATGRNPLPANDTTALRTGQVMYDRHCAVCHGAQGKGNGPIIGPGKFPFAPDLTAPVTVGRTDAYIYAVIAVGRNLMPTYGPRMSNYERWATVNYLRQLQRQSGAAPAAPDTAAARAPGR